MTHSQRLSSGSPACRLEWRPSRWLLASIALITLLAVLSLHASDMPGWLAWLLSGPVLFLGFRTLTKEWHRPPVLLVFRGRDLPVLVDGQAARDLVVQWRGPLAFVRWRDADSLTRRLSWWPDTLPPARRRELRLAADLLGASRPDPGMAP